MEVKREKERVRTIIDSDMSWYCIWTSRWWDLMCCAVCSSWVGMCLLKCLLRLSNMHKHLSLRSLSLTLFRENSYIGFTDSKVGLHTCVRDVQVFLSHSLHISVSHPPHSLCLFLSPTCHLSLTAVDGQNIWLCKHIRSLFMAE